MSQTKEKSVATDHSQPIYSPFTWPMSTIFAASKVVPENEPKHTHPKADAFLDVWGHIGSMIWAFRSFVLAYLCVYYIHAGEDGHGYPAFGAAKELKF
jgi:hypothetical protein